MGPRIMSDAYTCLDVSFFCCFQSTSWITICALLRCLGELEVRRVGRGISFSHHPRDVLLRDLVERCGVEGHTPGET